jgi:electron transfer flavoprotein-quinone oxidoreductase
MTERFDVIVIGAGPAGNAAAYTLAKAGFSVLQLERGESPGTKNVQGAILYANALEQIIPDFREHAPLERHIIEQRMWLVDEKSSHLSAHFRDEGFSLNRYTIIRAKFDRWFSDQVRKVGALVICETTVKDLLKDNNGKIIGVQTERENGDIFADVVILADGVNSLVGQQANLRKDIHPEHVALAVKEVLFLPKETIEQRFNLSNNNQGVVIEIAGQITRGMLGTGFLYTNKDSLSIGIGCLLSDMREQKMPPYQLLEELKQHPSIKPLIAGAEMKEYAAHLIPEGGYKSLPQLFGEGWLMVGDSAGFVNAVHREGSNLAMTSGRFAAETLIELKELGLPYTLKNFSRYKQKLDESFVMKDLKKYQNVPEVLLKHPQFLSSYPAFLNDAMREMLTVDGVDKRTKQYKIFQQLRSKRSIMGLLSDAYQFFKAFK